MQYLSVKRTLKYPPPRSNVKAHRAITALATPFRTPVIPPSGERRSLIRRLLATPAPNIGAGVSYGTGHATHTERPAHRLPFDPCHLHHAPRLPRHPHAGGARRNGRPGDGRPLLAALHGGCRCPSRASPRRLRRVLRRTRRRPVPSEDRRALHRNPHPSHRIHTLHTEDSAAPSTQSAPVSSRRLYRTAALVQPLAFVS